MLILTVAVDAPAGEIVGAKERIGVALEREGYTDMKVVSVVEKLPEQIKMRDM